MLSISPIKTRKKKRNGKAGGLRERLLNSFKDLIPITEASGNTSPVPGFLVKNSPGFRELAALAVI